MILMLFAVDVIYEFYYGSLAGVFIQHHLQAVLAYSEILNGYFLGYVTWWYNKEE